MELLKKITDKDIGEEMIKMNNPNSRIAVRAMILDNCGKIAIMYKKEKNEYKIIRWWC